MSRAGAGVVGPRIRLPRTTPAQVGHISCAAATAREDLSWRPPSAILVGGPANRNELCTSESIDACQRLLALLAGWHKRNRWQYPPHGRAATLLEGHAPTHANRARRAMRRCATAPTRRRRAARAASPLHRCAVAPMTQSRETRAASSTFASSQAKHTP